MSQPNREINKVGYLTPFQVKAIRKGMVRCPDCGEYVTVLTKAHINNHGKFPVVVSYMKEEDRNGNQ